ncbi:AAA family ATPase [Halomonas sp. KG2]|uniref:TrlF family AAA-like ATPase n=1 Tax=Halomonas sp. KG2 TaxID=2951138 RepID=UPI002647F57B|nr:AAA family ATPase [Halomonas sp. KG2]WKD28105.1 AAA family ATPase [Halomonas sp. KG2]
MSATYTGAKFWKCALQVNPYRYTETFRSQSHGLSEEAYNQQLVDICLEEGIKVLGIADHGSVEDIESIRRAAEPHGIVVFPGFEIASSEQAHFVCLFQENTDLRDLHGQMTVGFGINTQKPGAPVNRTSQQILQKVEDLGGFAYAAHVTSDDGVLKQRLHNVWRLQELSAAQIPGSVEGLKPAEDGFFYKVARNKDENYKRETPLAIINARDVETPETLRHLSASCLIKMTTPCFASFKQAFCDSESRIRLNSDAPQHHASAIETIKVVGGYLDGLNVALSDHLNAVIGGRGTGKSTLIECIRFVLGIRPLGRHAQRQHDATIEENLGKEKAQVFLTVRSASMHGRRFTVSRRFGDNPVVKDENGDIVPFSPNELMPRFECFGQNEIYEITQEPSDQRQLLSRFLQASHSDYDAKLDGIRKKLSENREAILRAIQQKAEVEADVEQLPKLEAKAAHYKELGLEEKLQSVPLLEKERQLNKRAQEGVQRVNGAIQYLRDSLPDSSFLSDQALAHLPNAALLLQQRVMLDALRTSVEKLIGETTQAVERSQGEQQAIETQLLEQVRQQEEQLEKHFKKIPGSQGKSGQEIGNDYKSILQAIERIQPRKTKLHQRQEQLEALWSERRSLLAELGDTLSERAASLQQALRRLQRKLKGKLSLGMEIEGDRQPLVDFLRNCNLENIGEKRLAWVLEAKASPVLLAHTIRQGRDELLKTEWGITPTVADALVRLSENQLLALEELSLPDRVTIELNVAHDDAQEQYRPLERLSTGQQCTAILHLLLLDNQDPLILDQPEDNLDNAFIAERIVAELRKAKLDRQFLFATHNANIPVFGDAEWIGVFEAGDDQATIPEHHQGAIDMEEVQKLAADILEGGKKAFEQRRMKYNF